MSWTVDNKSIEQQGLQHVKRITFTASVTTLQMKKVDKIVKASGATIAGTVYLPPVAESIGQFFLVEATSVATGSVTVKPFEGTAGADSTLLLQTTTAATSEVLSAAKAWILVMSNGVDWLIVAMNLDAA